MSFISFFVGIFLSSFFGFHTTYSPVSPNQVSVQQQDVIEKGKIVTGKFFYDEFLKKGSPYMLDDIFIDKTFFECDNDEKSSTLIVPYSPCSYTLDQIKAMSGKTVEVKGDYTVHYCDSGEQCLTIGYIKYLKNIQYIK